MKDPFEMDAATQDILMAQTVRVAQLLREPKVAQLPIFIENDLNAPLAYTNTRGIYCRADLAKNRPHQFAIVLMHEIFHHVIKQPERTAGFPHARVNRAEDFIINWLIYTMFGLDVRSMKLNLLWNPTYGKMDLFKLCGCIRTTGRPSCGHRGFAHPTILQVAFNVRKRFGLNLEANQSLIRCDAVDDMAYSRVTYLMQDRWVIPEIPTNLERLVRSLFMLAYQRTPTPAPFNNVQLTNEQALTYGWFCHHLRRNTTQRPEEAMLAVVLWLRVVTHHKDLLRRKLMAAYERLNNLEDSIDRLHFKIVEEQGKRKPKKKRIARWQKQRNEKQDRIPDRQKAIERAKENQKYPIEVLLRDNPVFGALRTKFKSQALSRVTYLAELDEAVLGVMSKMPRVWGKKTVKVLKELSRINDAQLERLLSIKDDLQEAFKDIAAPQSEDDIPDPSFDLPVPDPQNRQPKPAWSDDDVGRKSKEKGEQEEPHPTDDGEGEGDESADEKDGEQSDKPGSKGKKTPPPLQPQPDGEGEPSQGEEGAGDDAGEGGSDSPSDGDEQEGCGDNDWSPEDAGSDGEEGVDQEGEVGGGKGSAKKGNGRGTIWTQVVQMDDRTTDILRDVLSYMQYFETALKVHPKKNSDPDAVSLDNVLAFGNDLSRVEMSELALLASPETELLFYSKLANSSLAMRVPKERKRQPLIITVDCSGSMMGARYAVACGFALAMVKLLTKEKRGWGFQLFSGSVVGTIYNNGKDMQHTMVDVIKMIMTPHSGGTSFPAALHGALDLKEKAGWKDEGTSIMIVSDGEGNINEEEAPKILERMTPVDKVTGIVVTQKAFRGLYRITQDVYRVRKRDLKTELVKVGNSLL